MNLFRSGGGYVIALTYGSDRDWVHNVLVAGRCHVETRGRRLLLVEPRIVKDEGRTLAPPPVRAILKALGVTEFLELRESGRTSGRSGSGTR